MTARSARRMIAVDYRKDAISALMSRRTTATNRGWAALRARCRRIGGQPPATKATRCVEANQGRPAKPRSGSQQEQRAIAQSGKIARAGGGHPCEQTRGRSRPAPGDGLAAHRTQKGLPGWIDRRNSEPVLAILVGDGGKAPHQRAIAQRVDQAG
jgi:hypothetical protein